MATNDSKNSIFTAAPGQEAAPSIVETHAGGNAANGLTADDIRKVVAEVLTDYDRAQQSQRDKMEARIQKSVKSQLEALKETGVEVTPAVAKAIEQRTRQNVSEDEPQTVEPNMPAKRAQPDTAPDTAVFQQIARELQEETGMALYDNDPEVKNLDWSTPLKFTKSLDKAIEAKRLRVEQANKQAAQGRVTAPAAGNQPANLEAAYHEEMKKAQGNVNQFLSIKEKYRKLGLNV